MATVTALVALVGIVVSAGSAALLVCFAVGRLVPPLPSPHRDSVRTVAVALAVCATLGAIAVSLLHTGVA